MLHAFYTPKSLSQHFWNFYYKILIFSILYQYVVIFAYPNKPLIYRAKSRSFLTIKRWEIIQGPGMIFFAGKLEEACDRFKQGKIFMANQFKRAR